MRAFLITVCLVANTVLSAQPAVTNEVIVATHPAATASLQIASPAVALASDRHGVALAWAMPAASAPSRVHVARLGGPIRVLAPRSEGEFVAPIDPTLAAAPGNDGFVAAWIETNRGRFGLGRPQAAFAFLDAGLHSASAAFLTANEVTSPVIVRSGTAVWIAAGGEVWEVERNGTTRRSFVSDFRASAMAIVEDEPTVLSRHAELTRVASCAAPASGFIVTPCYGYLADLRLDQRFATITTERPRFESLAEPAVAAEGDRLLIAWLRGDQAAGGDVVLSTIPAGAPDAFPAAVENAKRIGTFAPDEGPTRPDIATDGERRVIVWRTKSPRRGYDVVAAVVDADGTVTRFDVATSNADERDPSVLALSGGNFIVAYEKFSGGQRSIAWRLVLMEGRRRAVR